VTDDELLPIGRFARASGLTVGALRHYDEEGVLVPADVDPATGYRRYRRDQLPMARAVAALRDLELSIPAIRALLDADDPAIRATILHDERLRLEARTARLQRALHRLHMLSVTADQRATAATPRHPADPATDEAASPTPRSEDLSVPTPPPPPTLDPETHRALAAGLFNRSWDLLEIEDRSARQDAELIDTAHASAWHWRQVGNAANEARGHWMLARVYSVLGHGAEAVYHARRANEVLDLGGEGIEDWDRPAAAEAMARALVASGDLAAAAEWKARAAELLGAVADEEDRSVVEGDLAALPV
jgi:DNA-binding transcriptional MerR regulator